MWTWLPSWTRKLPCNWRGKPYFKSFFHDRRAICPAFRYYLRTLNRLASNRKMRTHAQGVHPHTVFGRGRRAAPSAPGCGASEGFKGGEKRWVKKSSVAALGDGLTRSASQPTI